MVHYQVSSSSISSTPNLTSSYTFSNNTFTGLTSNWGTGWRQYIQVLTRLKYWFQHLQLKKQQPVVVLLHHLVLHRGGGFTGLVSFTVAPDTIGDGSSNLSFGVVGSTLINGDNISTGKISSTNLVTVSGFTYNSGEFGRYWYGYQFG